MRSSNARAARSTHASDVSARLECQRAGRQPEGLQMGFPFLTQSIIFQTFEIDYVNHDPPPGCDFRWFRDSDGPTMARYGYPRFYINERLKNGARIVVAEFEGRTVGWKILQTGKVDQLSWLRVLVPPDMVFALAEFVVPEMREKGLGKSMHEFGIAHYQSEGYRRIGCNVETSNTYQIQRLTGEGAWSEVTTATRRNYLLFHTAEVDGETYVGLWGRFNRFPLEVR
jgi:hypothetical protein